METSSAETGSSQHDEVGLQDEGARDADALALASRELVGVAGRLVGLQAHQVHDLAHPLSALLGRADAVDAQTFADAVPDGRPRIEGCIRILEDDLHPAAEWPERGPRDPGDVHAVELDGAGGRVQEPQQQPPDGGLAAA